MSYTKFEYSNLHVSTIHQTDSDSAALEAAWAAGKAAPISEGSSAAAWLHRPLIKVQFQVKNSGNVDGAEVRIQNMIIYFSDIYCRFLQIPQLYVHHPANAGEPPSVLKGFTDIFLKHSQTKTVTLTLSRYDLSIWDVVAQGWVKPEGKISFSVGASSRDFRLSGTVPV